MRPRRRLGWAIAVLGVVILMCSTAGASVTTGDGCASRVNSSWTHARHILAPGDPTGFGPCAPGVIAVTARHRDAERVRIPQVAGTDLSKAYTRLHQAGLRVTFAHTFSDDGLSTCLPDIKASRPGPGRRVRVGTTIDLKEARTFCAVGSPAVPTGPLPSATVPSFTGQTVLSAVRWAGRHQLYWQALDLPELRGGDASQLLANYQVSAQKPAAGKTLKLGIGHTCCNGHGGSFLPTPLTLRGVQYPSTASG